MNKVCLYQNYEKLMCKFCGRDILENDGYIVIVRDIKTNKIVDVFSSCKGNCMEFLRDKRIKNNEIEKIKDITDLKNPLLFLKFIITIMDTLKNEENIESNAYENLRDSILKCAQFVMRDVEDYERDRASWDNILPF